MVHAPQRAALSGPTLVRLLARLADLDVAASAPSLSDRLSEWLGWTDAIALSTALCGDPPVVASRTTAPRSDEAQLCARVRRSLSKAIASDGMSTSWQNGPAPARADAVPLKTAVDYAVFRQHYVSMQQAMETDIGALRGRLRARLAARSPGMARLAMVDAVMERALSARERGVFASVPALLGGYFERVRSAAQPSPSDDAVPQDAVAAAPGPWLDVFRKDMQSVLLAELEVRFQPVEGLLAALRTS
jgi:hypothetical protein